MTRSEAYAEGFHTGRKWAEEDISAHRGDFLECPTSGGNALWRAEQLGTKRGYRDTWARFEAGTLTRQMFEHAPRGGTRA